MTNFIEETKADEQETFWNKVSVVSPEDINSEEVGVVSDQNVNELIERTITNTLNHILESGLLEEKEEHQDWCKLTGELEYSSCGCWKDHNTLARNFKEFISNMDTKSVDSIHSNKQAN